MPRAINETLFSEVGPVTNLNIITNKVLPPRETSGVREERYQVKRVCTETDNALKRIMTAHLKERARNA